MAKSHKLFSFVIVIIAIAAYSSADSYGAGCGWTDGNIYFFKGSNYVRFSLLTGEADLPQPIVNSFPREFHDINACFVIPGGRGEGTKDLAYFVKGDEVIAYDIASRKIVEQSKIRKVFPGVFEKNIDAVLVLPESLYYRNGYKEKRDDHFIFFFKGETVALFPASHINRRNAVAEMTKISEINTFASDDVIDHFRYGISTCVSSPLRSFEPVFYLFTEKGYLGFAVDDRDGTFKPIEQPAHDYSVVLMSWMTKGEL